VIGLPALKSHVRVVAGGLLLTAATAIAAIAAPAASAAAAADRPGTGNPPGEIPFSAVGATPKGPNGRYVFYYDDIKPGTVIKDWVELYNGSSQEAAFQVYTVDATGTTLGGSLIFDQANQKPKDIGTWGTFYNSPTQPSVAQASFVMGGGHGIIEPFTITVPDDATPGDHTGGLIAQVGVTTVNAKGERVTVYSRIALPIELRVTGPLTEGLQVQSISTDFNDPINPFGPGSATISYSVANTGNVRISGTEILKVSGLFASAAVNPPKLPTILPGDSVRVTTTVGGLYPAGSFATKVTVTPRWPALSPQTSLTLATVTGSASFFAVPWALVVLIVLLAGLGYGAWRVLRWRVRQRAADMAAVAEAARKDAERQMSRKAESTTAKAAAGAKADAKPDGQGAAE
jgi:hypothetical protein